MIPRALLVTALLSLAAVAPARAGHVTIGSNLSAPAARYESAPVDSVYWNTELAGRARVRAPRRGEVSTVRLKGRINKTGDARPNVVMHIQVLRPAAGGKVRAVLTSGDLKLPVGGRPNRITTYKLQSMPARICVRRGDYVALSTSGGFGDGYPNGAQFAMFGSVDGSAFDSFTGAGQDMDGDVFAGHTHANRELLLQARIATGKAARPTCQ